MSVATDAEGEARDLRYPNALGLTQVLRSFVSKVITTVKRYVDLLETKLLALGLDPALIGRGPTAAVLGLAVSALTHAFHKMSPQ